MNDLELHQLVRDSLNEFKPAYDPRHWRLLQSRLILETAGFPWKFLALLAIPLTLAGTWWWTYQPSHLSQKSLNSATVSQVHLKSAPTTPVFTPYLPPGLQAAVHQQSRSSDLNTSRAAIDRSLSFPPGQPAALFTLGPRQLETDIKLTSHKTYFVERKIRSLLMDKTIEADSTTYKVLERNKNKWENAVVVCDWTSSMFPYGTQIFTWLDHNQYNEALQGYVFFNDCDINGKPLEASGRVGGMFHTTEKEPDEVLKVMINAVRNGAENSDLVENDLEALVFAAREYPDARELILIADNVSPVRYPKLLEQLQKPVRIIICGSTLTDQAIQPIYLDLAQATGGSIHTIEDDLSDLRNIPHGKWIRVGDRYFRYREKKKEFVLTSRRQRPKDK